MDGAPFIRVQAEPFDLQSEIRTMTRGRADIGAIVSFIGLCRDEAGTLSGLELEHYPGMAEAEIADIVAKACARWPLLGVTVIHRYGLLSPGEEIVLVVACAAHRKAAFAGAEFIMDFLKTRAPFWKKDHRRDAKASDWVSARDEDDEALGKWTL